MKLIKLDAIDSTNEFLKGLAIQQELENFTVVTAENQTKGKGQMGSVWLSDIGKNLIMSVFVKDTLVDVSEIYNLNIAVALAIIESLETFNIPQLSIKWPNDIMSYNFKIGGLLLENSIKSDGSLTSIIGFGLNVNQTNFENLPKASSLAKIVGSEFDKDAILLMIMNKLETNMAKLKQDSANLWKDYINLLFKKGVPMPFRNNLDQNFMGIIQGVSNFGNLQVLLEDDTVVEYSLKEIQMLY